MTKIKHVRPRRIPIKIPKIPEPIISGTTDLTPTKNNEPKVSEPVIILKEPEKSLKSRVKDLEIVMYKRESCPRCKIVFSEIQKLGLENDILYKDVDIDGLTGLSNLPIGSISLPIFTSKISKKNTFGYYPIEKIVSLLS